MTTEQDLSDLASRVSGRRRLNVVVKGLNATLSVGSLLNLARGTVEDPLDICLTMDLAMYQAKRGKDKKSLQGLIPASASIARFVGFLECGVRRHPP